jgi:hypothetical protein
MTELQYTVPLYVRSVHRHAYRPGQWAKVESVDWLPETYGPAARPGRPVLSVVFVDGLKGQWPLDDIEFYEFSGSVTR